ncbi:hypothetical protein HYU06_00665 [Candidatus Woesearchaeota archaeon]|nr:hypothetical protein [Candidatus Woesearchaeota archaeon]
MAADSLTVVNKQILKAIEDMIMSLKHIEESEIAAATVDVREMNELNDFANRHTEYLSRHPQYKKLVELTGAAGKTEQDRRLLAVKLIKQEYGPLLELRKQVDDELAERDTEVAGEKAELEKDFEFVIKDNKIGALELIMDRTKTVHYFAGFRIAEKRAEFKAALEANVKNTLALRQFIQENFEEKQYLQRNTATTTTHYYWAAKGDLQAKYDDLQYYQDMNGIVRPDFTKWVDKSKLERFVRQHLTVLLPRQQKILEAIEKDAKVIQLAEQRVAEQFEQEKSLKEIVKKKIKVEAKEFDEIHGGKIPEKYKNLVKELSSPKYLRNVIERARNSTDPNFKDKPVEVLKQDIDQKIPQDQAELKGLLLKELIPRLEKELNVLANRKPAKLVDDTLKEIDKELIKLNKEGKTGIAMYNVDKDAMALKQKIDYVRNLIVSSPLTREERVKAAGSFNVRTVRAMIRFYTREKLGFTADQVLKQIPALREITTEELSRYK